MKSSMSYPLLRRRNTSDAASTKHYTVNDAIAPSQNDARHRKLDGEMPRLARAQLHLSSGHPSTTGLSRYEQFRPASPLATDRHRHVARGLGSRESAKTCRTVQGLCGNEEWRLVTNHEPATHSRDDSGGYRLLLQHQVVLSHASKPQS